ncbi:MAG: glycosyltransferase [Actinomycetota bacterium]|nr:glycosyltransferase [Actinomycetota bacterium]
MFNYLGSNLATFCDDLVTQTDFQPSDRAASQAAKPTEERRVEAPSLPQQPNVVVVHDYLTGRGGAERVVLALARGLTPSLIMSSLYAPESTFEGFADFNVQTSWLDRFAVLQSDHRRAFALLRPTFSRMSVEGADVVICSSSGWAHGIQTTAPKIVYCHTPARWLHQPADFFLDQQKMTRRAIAWTTAGLRRWDRQAAHSATRYLANSSVVAKRIKRTYGIDADVVHPPPGLTPGPMSAIDGIEPGFLLSVGRNRRYKNVEAVVAAMAHLPGQRLITVGAGEPSQLTKNVQHVGNVSDEELRWLYFSARAVVSAAYEDFGLCPIEGFSFGTPAVVLRAGGFLDTMVEGLTGVYFERAEPWAIAAAIRQLPDVPDVAGIKAHAAKFSAESFQSRMREVIAAVL